MTPPVWTLTPQRFVDALAYLRGLARGDLARFEAAPPGPLAQQHSDAVLILDSLAMQAHEAPPVAPTAKVIPLRRGKAAPDTTTDETKPGPTARRVADLLRDDDSEEGDAR